MCKIVYVYKEKKTKLKKKKKERETRSDLLLFRVVKVQRLKRKGNITFWI